MEMSSNTPAGKPGELEALLKQGFAELSRGQVEAAADCARQALTIQADLVPAHFLIGLIGLEAKDRKTAFSAFQSVVKLDRDHAGQWNRSLNC